MSLTPGSTSVNEEDVSVCITMIPENTDFIVNGFQSPSGMEEKKDCALENESVTYINDVSKNDMTEEQTDFKVKEFDSVEKVDITCVESSAGRTVRPIHDMDIVGNEDDGNRELSIKETLPNRLIETKNGMDLPESETSIKKIVSNQSVNVGSYMSVEDSDDPPILDKNESNRRIVSSCINTESEEKSAFEVVEESNVEPTSNSPTATSTAASETSDYFSTTPNHSSPPMNEDSISYMSEDSNLPDLPQDVIEEERKFAQQTELDLRANSAAKLSGKEKERRLRSLMSLLGKSKEYASYMSLKLKTNKEMLKEAAGEEPPIPPNATNSSSNNRKRKNNDHDDNSTPKKAKTELEQPTYDPKTHYKNALNFVVSRRQPGLLLGGSMRDYQLDGLEWMIALYTNGVNGILADEMGLGKTIQTIALLCHLREKRIYGPHLIIGPLSTLPNWLSEFANFAPDVPVALFHGNEAKRSGVIERFVSCLKNKDKPNLPIIITSYEMPLRDKKFLSATKWRTIIVDEGHRLKNYQTMLARELRRYKTEFRLLLTGTPLQNNLSELWSLLNYLIPDIFDNLEMFENLFDFSDLRSTEKQKELIQKEKEEQLISKMHQILEPFLLRRVKTDVNIALPGKKEIVVKAPMTAEQRFLYKSVIDRSINEQQFVDEEKDTAELVSGKRRRSCARNKNYSEDWEVDDSTGDLVNPMLALPFNRTKKRVRSTDGEIEYVFNIKLCSPMMMLRKIANHPYLVKTPVFPGTRDIVINEDLIQQSGKLLVLDALLPRLKAGGHKVLLFSAFKILLDLIEDYVIMRQYKYVRFDGSTDIEDRLKYIKQFNTDEETFIFLITTRAGGLGVNLTGADTVIIYDSDWNPQVDLQAQDRCHRIGQWRPVVVYRLLTAGTVDEYILNMAVNKRRLEKLVVKKGKFKQGMNQEVLDLGELKELMESTDFQRVMHPNGLVLSDEEIERLLDRSDLIDKSTEKVVPSTSKVDKDA